MLFDGGVKVIDSSPMYGRAEAVVGDLLAKMHARERAFLATKVWTSGREEGIAQMRRSAELLKTRVIDLMQIHNLVDWRTQLATLRRMKEAGQVRYIGITHYTPSAFGDLADIIGREEIDFVQMPYSIDVRDAEKRLLPFAAERRVGVIVNRPFGGSGLFRQVRGKSLPPWAADFGCASWAQFFLRYIVSHSAVTCVIPATAEPAHLGDDLGAGYGRMPDSTERRRMAEYWDERRFLVLIFAVAGRGGSHGDSEPHRPPPNLPQDNLGEGVTRTRSVALKIPSTGIRSLEIQTDPPPGAPSGLTLRCRLWESLTLRQAFFAGAVMSSLAL